MSNQPAPHPVVVAHILRTEAARLDNAALGRPQTDQWFAQKWAAEYMRARANELEGRSDTQEEA